MVTTHFSSFDKKHSSFFSTVVSHKSGSIIASHSLEQATSLSPSTPDMSIALDHELKTNPNIKGFFLGIESDPLTPSRLPTTLACMDLLSSKGMKVWLQTSQLLDLNFLELLVRNQNQIHLILPFGFSKPSSQMETHPSTASRLKQLSTLKHLGTPLDIFLSQLVPGCDTRRNLSPLLRELAFRGFRKVYCSYDFQTLAPEGSGAFERLVCKKNQTAQLAYFGNCLLYSKKTRSQGYSRIMGLGQEFGIQIQIDEFSNPDFVKPTQIQSFQSPSNLKQKYLTQTGHQLRQESPTCYD